MASVQFKAIGKSLDDLARKCRDLPKGSPAAIAYANSGVLQQAGRVVADKYMVPGKNADTTKSGYLEYTAPPGATHGPIRTTRRSFKDGRSIQKTTERKIFVKGKFVSRTGEMEGFAKDLARSAPTERFGVIEDAENPGKKRDGKLLAEILPNGNGALTLSGGYRAAEAGSRARSSNGVKGWWRGLRTASGRWSTLIKKKYPELLRIT
jgi:hypothetical protein